MEHSLRAPQQFLFRVLRPFVRLSVWRVSVYVSDLSARSISWVMLPSKAIFFQFFSRYRKTKYAEYTWAVSSNQINWKRTKAIIILCFQPTFLKYIFLLILTILSEHCTFYALFFCFFLIKFPIMPPTHASVTKSRIIKKYYFVLNLTARKFLPSLRVKRSASVCFCFNWSWYV